MELRLKLLHTQRLHIQYNLKVRGLGSDWEWRLERCSTEDGVGAGDPCGDPVEGYS